MAVRSDCPFAVVFGMQLRLHALEIGCSVHGVRPCFSEAISICLGASGLLSKEYARQRWEEHGGATQSEVPCGTPPDYNVTLGPGSLEYDE